jgi:hypothetical protein
LLTFNCIRATFPSNHIALHFDCFHCTVFTTL